MLKIFGDGKWRNKDFINDPELLKGQGNDFIKIKGNADINWQILVVKLKKDSL